MLFYFFVACWHFYLLLESSDMDLEVEKQKEMFDTEFDTNGDGRLDSIEFKRWVAPSNE